MLLDEPSNHLDIDATRWLEDYLVKQPQAMLIVSHDRYFLNRVVTKVFELHNGALRSFPGNFDAYVRQRAERYEQELKAWEAQKEYVEKQEEYIRRVHYGQLAKQAQSRRKALDRLERVERPTMIAAPRMHFGEVRRAGDIVIDADRVSKAYDKPLFTDLSFALPRGKRLGIMGPNGCGKTTLVRLILGEEQPDSGTIRQGHLTDLGYLDQHLRESAGGRNGPAGRLAGTGPGTDRAADARPARPLRPDRRPGRTAGRRPVRRRAEPGGAGEARRRRGQRPHPRRADQPPRHLGLRRFGSGSQGIRGHRPSLSATTATS